MHSAFSIFITKENPKSMYPFANAQYRNIFRHTLWMVSGVKAAKSLSAMLKEHPVFSYFNIVNVAGGDEEKDREEALKKEFSLKFVCFGNNYFNSLLINKPFYDSPFIFWQLIKCLSHN